MKIFERDTEAKKKLATFLDEIIESVDTEIGSLTTRWKVNQQYYNNDPSVLPVSSAIPEMTPQVFPFVQPRLDSISDQICSAVCNNEPYLIGKRRGESKRNESVENTVQFFWNIGKLNEALEVVSPITGVTNLGIIRQTFQVHQRDFLAGRNQNVETNYTGDVGFAGLVYDVIPPEDFVIFKAAIKGIETAPCVGHRFFLLRAEIDEFRDAGIYYEHDELTSDSTDENDIGRSSTFSKLSPGAVSDKDTDAIKMYELYIKYKFDDDKNQRWYKVIYAKTSGEILRVDEWQYSRPPYFDFRWKPRQYGNFYPSSSVAQDLQGLAWQFSNLSNVAVYGAWFNALPIIANSGMSEGTQPLVAGSMIGTNGNEVTPIQSQFNLSAIFPMLQQISDVGDSVGGMTRAGMAMASTAKTATQQMSEDAGQANRVGGYIRRYGDALADMACAAQELLYANFDTWYPIYGQEVPITDAEELIAPMQWQLQNQNPQQSPMQKLQNLQMLSQMAMADQSQMVQNVMQLIAQFISQVIPDPQQAEQVFMQLEAQVRAMQSQGMNMQEIKKTIVYAMNLPNAEKILNEEPDQSGGVAGSVPLSLPQEEPTE